MLDFGIARRHAGASSGVVTQTGSVLGTPQYMAPEQARGLREVGPPADVFSLGCVLFECLCGQPPFLAEHQAAVLARILFEEAPPLSRFCPQASERLTALVARMLAKDPQVRPASGDVVEAELAGLEPDGCIKTPGLAQTIELLPTLRGSEQQLVSVVFAAPPAELVAEPATPPPGDGGTALRSAVDSALLLFGARSEWLADGSVVAALLCKGSATDQAVLAARCALCLHELWPDAVLAIATGRGQLRESTPVGEVIDRAVQLAHVPLQPGSGVRLDELSAGLLSARFSLQQRGGLTLLSAERASTDAARLLLGKPTPCVGREQELGLLESVVTVGVAESSARAALVTGQPGTGKSRLMQELLLRLRPRDELHIEVLTAHGDPTTQQQAYGILAQALRLMSGLQPTDTAQAQHEALGRRIARSMPIGEQERAAQFLAELCSLPSASGSPAAGSPVLLAEARQDPQRMAESIRLAFCDLMRAECAAHPVLLVVEDLHWADAQSVQLLGELLLELSEQPLVILATGRPEVHGRFPKLWGGRAVEVPLRGLARKACERLIQHVLRQVPGQVLDPQTLRRLVDQSGGNALFLEELIRAHAEGRGDDPPATVLAMVQARIQQLDPEVRQVVRAASVFGQTFWRGGVQALLGHLPAAEIERCCHALFEAEFIEHQRKTRYPGEPQYGFRHMLLRDAAYELLTDEDRRIGHQLAGRYLEQAGEADPLVLLGHFDKAGDKARAVPCHLLAGERARRLGQFADAQVHFRAAVELSGGLPPSPKTRRQHIEASVRLVEVTLILDRTSPGLLELLEAAAAQLEDSGSDEDAEGRAWVEYMMGRLHYFRGSPQEAIRYYERMLPQARRLGRAELVAFPSALLGTALTIQGDLVRAMPLLAEAVPLLLLLEDDYEWTRVRLFQGVALMLGGRGEAGRAIFTEVGESTRGKPRLASLAALTALAAHSLAGQWAAAAALAPGAFAAHEEIGDRGHLFLSSGALAWVLAELGRADQARSCLTHALALRSEVGRIVAYDWALAGCAQAAAGLGELDVASQLATELLETLDSRGTLLSTGLAACALGRVAALRGAPAAQVDELFERALARLRAGELWAPHAVAQQLFTSLQSAQVACRSPSTR